MLESIALKPIDEGNPASFRKKWMWVVTWWLYNDAGLFGPPAEINVVVLLDGRVLAARTRFRSEDVSIVR